MAQIYKRILKCKLRLAQEILHSVQNEYGDPAEVINRDLDKMRQVMDAVFSYYTAVEVMPSAKDVDARFREKMGLVKARTKTTVATCEKTTVSKKKEVGLFEAFDEFCRECGEKNAWTKATFQKMGSLREDLKAFRKKLQFSDLTESVLKSGNCPTGCRHCPNRKSRKP